MKLQNLSNILIAIVCIGLFPNAQAVVPAPDGGYPGGNTAEGQAALLSLTTGGFNTAVGFLSLRSNATGQLNTAIGAGTLLANTADRNTATGAGTLLSNTTGGENTANGAFALFSNTAGGSNTAVGDAALSSNTTGSINTAVGAAALSANTTGFGNTALGDGAGSAVTTADYVICIGAYGANVDNTTWISNIYGISTVSGSTLPVIVSDNGQLGTASSSRRFKKEIKPMERASEAILGLKPVTFHYKSDPASAGPQFGLIAEDVAEINPDLVVRDKNGEIYTVRYDAVNAMLLNEFLKEHRRVEQQEGKIEERDCKVQEQVASIAALKSTLAEQQKGMEVLTAQLKEQAAQIRKVSDQFAAASPSRCGLETSKFATGRIRRGGTAPQIVLNNQ
jgi:uncharacterized coiled-coil protein SlyX